MDGPRNTTGNKSKCAVVSTGWSYSSYSEYHFEQRFSDHLISRRYGTEWWPHSPDLCSPDFYLWSLLNDRVYPNNSKTIAELKLAITLNICEIKKEECARVIYN